MAICLNYDHLNPRMQRIHQLDISWEFSLNFNLRILGLDLERANERNDS